MSLKVVHTMMIPGIDFGEKLLEPLDATLVTGSWRTEDELISHTAGADAVNTDVKKAWLEKWGQKA
jgi:hypothetical protein